MRGYGKCPRCGCASLEHLETHTYCWECNFSPAVDYKSVHLNEKHQVIKTTVQNPEENYQDWN